MTCDVSAVESRCRRRFLVGDGVLMIVGQEMESRKEKSGQQEEQILFL